MIEYIDSHHIYLADGVIIPSVSKLVNFATGDDYSSIPQSILQAKQQFGTKIHHAIEVFIETGIVTQFNDVLLDKVFNEFLGIHQEYIGLDAVVEKIISFDNRYAGRIDCLSDGVLIDFKTSYKLNIPHLEWQLGFYQLALESENIKIEKCMCLWLPKQKKAKWVEITPKTKEECIEVLKRYENQRHNED